MNHNYYSWPKYAGVLIALGLSLPASAQYVFTDDNLLPYRQNFDTLSDTARFTNGTTTQPQPDIVGLYAEAQADSLYGGESRSPETITANDGSTVSGNYYHFGQTGATDRAFGGIAKTEMETGFGYVGIRLKNNSTQIIENLDLQYAMEQWYNSGNASAAYVKVSYRKSSGVAGENMASLRTGAVGDAWTAIPELTVTAPSTGTAIQSRDGNSPANRREAQHTLNRVTIMPGQEIMLRWDYVLNPTTNGNGVSIDDVVITPQTSVFFAEGDGLAPATGTGTALDWRNTMGVAPTSLSAPNRTYYVKGKVSTADLAAITGVNSKIVLGVPAQKELPDQPGILVVADSTALHVSLDVSAGSTLRIEEGAATTPLRLGTLAPGSTVVYASSLASHTVRALSYGHLRLEGTGPKILGGHVLINGNLQLDSAKLLLGDFNATITKGGRVAGSGATAYVVTNQKGRLRQSVLGDAVEVLFPVGTATSYKPVRLQQSTARSEDVFAVRVTNDRYASYGAADAGMGAPVAPSESVRPTWLVSEEVAGSSNLRLQLQWSAADQTADFVPAQAYVSHFHNGYWDRTAVGAGAIRVPATTDTYTLLRTGITSFSPFSVSSDAARPLPVTLTSFQARRTGPTVTCTWATATEQDNAYFVLERSLNSRTFEALDTVQAAGTSSTRRHYSAQDHTPAAATTYYRLRQVDTSGEWSYSSIMVVQGAQASLAAIIAPNPSTGHITLTFPAAQATTLRGRVVTVLGKSVLHFTQSVAAGGQLLPLDLSAQPAGIYLLHLQTPQGQQTLRLLKN